MSANIRPESVEDPKEVRRLAGERREKIRDLLLDLLTGSEISNPISDCDIDLLLPSRKR
jgi:hypothetical protein